MKTKQIVQHIAIIFALGVAASAQAQLLGGGGGLGRSVGGMIGGSGNMGGQIGGMGSMGSRGGLARRPARQPRRRSGRRQKNCRRGR
ncbi:hypothetical protein LP420_26995 [Massilia sp. B-10]|nr:hypothetical protein LP420_26995 [Massilia sp. B-10]